MSDFMFPKWYRFQITSALSILHHLCNGNRHLAWDAGYGFEIRDAYRSGYAVLPRRAVLTILAWLYVFLA